MKLTLDRRESLKSGGPATHVLVVGISRYAHLPAQAETQLVQINTAAQSAYEFYQWLNENRDNLAVPLATCRVMLVPSDAELGRISELKGLAGPCAVSDFVSAASQWRKDAIGNRENALLLYFAGHSLEPTESNPLLMFDDFGDGVGRALRATVPLSNLIDGLAPSDWQRDIGRQQFLFIDTDRLPRSECRLRALSGRPRHSTWRGAARSTTAAVASCTGPRPAGSPTPSLTA